MARAITALAFLVLLLFVVSWLLLNQVTHYLVNNTKRITNENRSKQIMRANKGN